MWSSLVKIQYTEQKLVTIYVETTLLSKILFIVMVTLTFDPKINRVLPLPHGNYVAKFAKDPIYISSHNKIKKVQGDY